VKLAFFIPFEVFTLRVFAGKNHREVKYENTHVQNKIGQFNYFFRSQLTSNNQRGHLLKLIEMKG